MLADAIAAERFRLLRDRSALFWGFCFAPLVAFMLSVAGDLFLRKMIKRPMPGAMVDLTGQVLKSLGDGASIFASLFLLIGAAAVIAGDYRWETWRLLTPRNSRANLLGAKLVVVGEAVFWNLVLLMVMTLGAALVGAAINSKPVFGSATEAGLGAVLGVFSVTWLEAMTLVALAACVSVLTRSTMGAVVACVVARFVQSILASALPALSQHPDWKVYLVPAYSAEVLRAYIAAPLHGGFGGGQAASALAVLLGWIVILTATALALFQRQDLTRE